MGSEETCLNISHFVKEPNCLILESTVSEASPAVSIVLNPQHVERRSGLARSLPLKISARGYALSVPQA